MDLKPNPDATLSFLQKFKPEGLWVIVAIKALDPDAGRIHTRSWRPDQWPEMAAWMAEYEGWNFYFTVNDVRGPVRVKPKREAIERLVWLHVDIDPRPGEDIAEEKARALKMLQSTYRGVPPASVILDSGGGLQGFWKLREPFEINGQPEKYEEAKLWNLKLEQVYGADHCNNVDRIMRLPGTINYPNRKKLKKGREPALAKVLQWTPDGVYDLSQFIKAQVVQSNTPSSSLGTSSATAVSVGGNIQRLDDVHDLDQHCARPVSDVVKATIVQGDHPNTENQFESRSEALFYVLCELVRADCPDEIIYSVITDPDFLISGSVLDKKGQTQRYALRQIQRAKENAIDPRLRELNERFAVIGNWGGKCRIVEEVWDDRLKRSSLTKQSFQDFHHRFGNEKIQVGVDRNDNPMYKTLGKWWTENEARRTYDRVVFWPDRETSSCYNLWQGFTAEQVPGDVAPFLNHVRDNICSGVEANYKYLLGWLALCIQKPAAPGQVAIVLRGKRGTGKSLFIKIFGSLWGRHFLQVSDPKHLVGSFNAHLRDCIVLFGDEAFYAGDKAHESILKTLITEDSLAVEAKGVDMEVAANYVHLLLASNSDWVVPSGPNERRFCVLDVADHKIQDSDYFGRIIEWADNGGREALLHYLKTYDLSDFDVFTVPDTAALTDQKVMSFSPEEEWWHTKLMEGQVLTHDEGWSSVVPCDDLYRDYYTYARDAGVYRRANKTTFGRFFKKFLPGGLQWTNAKVKRYVTKAGTDELIEVERTTRVYVIPSLAKCQEYWRKEFAPGTDFSAGWVSDPGVENVTAF